MTELEEFDKAKAFIMNTVDENSTIGEILKDFVDAVYLDGYTDGFREASTELGADKLIVRCKDCIHYKSFDLLGLHKDPHYFCSKKDGFPEDHPEWWFCPEGERRN